MREKQKGEKGKETRANKGEMIYRGVIHFF